MADPVEDAKRRFAIGGGATLADLPALYAQLLAQGGAPGVPGAGGALPGAPGRRGGGGAGDSLGIGESGSAVPTGAEFGPGTTADVQEFEAFNDFRAANPDVFGDQGGGFGEQNAPDFAGVSDLGFFEGLAEFGPNLLSILGGPLAAMALPMDQLVGQQLADLFGFGGPGVQSPVGVPGAPGGVSAITGGSGGVHGGEGFAGSAFNTIGQSRAADAAQNMSIDAFGGGGGGFGGGGFGGASNEAGGFAEGGGFGAEDFHEGGLVPETLVPGEEGAEVEATLLESEYVVRPEVVEALGADFFDGIQVATMKLRDIG